MAVVDLKFTIDGTKVLEPVEWQDLKEVYEYGQNSNQPAIEAESFTFRGESAQIIYNHIKSGQILVPLSVSVDYTQQGNTQRLMDDYVIDTTKGVTLNDAWFNNDLNPKEVIVNIRKKDGSDYFLTEIQGLTWSLLVAQGYVSESDFVTVKTVVSPEYNFVDIATAIINIYVLSKQLQDTVSIIKDRIQETIMLFGQASADDVSSPISYGFTIAYQIAVTLIDIALAVVTLALLIKATLDIIAMLVPPTLKNQGITLKRGMEIICERLGYTFSPASNLSILDYATYMPSGNSVGDKNNKVSNFISTNLPQWIPNKRGIPNSYDYGYFAVDFVELVKKLVNGRIDISNGVVYLRNEDDQTFFESGSYQHRIQPNYTNIEYNLPEIPHTRLLSYETDMSDTYTSDYQDGRLWEVKNVSKDGNLPFTGGEYINFNVCQGYRRVKTNPIEDAVIFMAGVADTLASLLGQKTKLKEEIQSNRTGVLAVSQNNFSKPKLVYAQNGNIPSNYLDIIGAEAIENAFYINRSIKRGTGQKIILRGVTVPMSLADRDKIKNNGNFKDDYWGNCTFKSVEYQFSKDTAICDIEVDYDYIATNTFDEVTYNGL